MRLARLSRSLLVAMAIVAPCLLVLSMPLLAADDSDRGAKMVVVVVTYSFPGPVTLGEVRRAAARGAQRYLNLPGSLSQ